MENQQPAATGAFNSPISLQLLVNNLVNNSRSAANGKKTHVVNEVDQEIELGPSTQSAIAVMSDLLSTVVANSRNGEIHITADKFRDVVTVEIQERNNYNGYALAYSVGSIEPDAAVLGGHITIKGPQQKVTTISFSFPSQFAA